MEHANPLFAAFLAGFNASSPSFNGETIGPVTDDPRGGALEDVLRAEYDLWRLEQEAEPGGG